MPGGDACNICNNASKYQYIMEEVVTELKDVKDKLVKLDEKLDERDEKLNQKIDENNKVTNEKMDNYIKWGTRLVVANLGTLLGIAIAWGLSLLH